MTDRSTVWLANGGSAVAHLPDGWAGSLRSTACGVIIADAAGMSDYGLLIQWRLLDHDVVRRCRRCWP